MVDVFCVFSLVQEVVYKKQGGGGGRALIVVSKYRETNESTRPLRPSAFISFEIFGYHDQTRSTSFLDLIASQTAYINYHLNCNSTVTFFLLVA